VRKPKRRNLRDFDWDFKTAWNAPAMVARRKKAEDGCFCTHESILIIRVCRLIEAFDSNQTARKTDEKASKEMKLASAAGRNNRC